MKKILSILLITFLILSITGCSKNETSFTTVTSQQEIVSNIEDNDIILNINCKPDNIYDFTDEGVLNEKSDIIFKGLLINKKSYVIENGIVKTDYYFNISTLIKGDYISQQITVTDIGGIVPYKEYAKVAKLNKNFENDISEAIKEKGEIKYTFDGAPLLDLNAEYNIYCLKYDISGNTFYSPLGNYQGIFSLNASTQTLERYLPN